MLIKIWFFCSRKCIWKCHLPIWQGDELTWRLYNSKVFTLNANHLTVRNINSENMSSINIVHVQHWLFHHQQMHIMGRHSPAMPIMGRHSAWAIIHRVSAKCGDCAYMDLQVTATNIPNRWSASIVQWVEFDCNTDKYDMILYTAHKYDAFQLLTCWIVLKITTNILTLWIISWILLDPRRWNWLWNINTCYHSYTVITMPAVALATLGAWASVDRIFCFQHHLDDIGITMHLKKRNYKNL